MPKVRLNRSSSAAKQKPAEKKLVQKHVHVEARIGIMASSGDQYKDESIEEFIDKFRKFAEETWPGRLNFTVVGNYYIVDGKVCRPEDFDRESMDRKPGTFPPSWSLTGDEKKEALNAEKIEEQAQYKEIQEERERGLADKSNPKKPTAKQQPKKPAPKKLRISR